jgi:2-polyprenyl-3-methyl-5-hydroxy-6-metoxy-1,4-benzoquinol methylase
MKPEAERVRAFFETDSYLAGNAGIAVRAQLVERLLGPCSNAGILDLGCGDGSLSLPFLECGNALTLVDFSESMLDRARSATPAPHRDRAQFVQSDISTFEPSDRYDVVLCVGVLAHVPSVPETVRKVAASLRPGGQALIQISDASLRVNWLLQKYQALRALIVRDARQVVNRITAAELVELARSSGLELVASERYSFGLPGTRILPYRWRRAFELYTVNHPFLMHRGIETLLLFLKAGGDKVAIGTP